MAGRTTHTVDAKRLANKHWLLFLWPVTLAFPLLKTHLHTDLKTQTEMCRKAKTISHRVTEMKGSCQANCSRTGGKASEKE